MTSNFVSSGSMGVFGTKTLRILGVISLGLALSGCIASSRLGGGLISPSQEAAPQAGPAETESAPPVTSEPIAGTELPPPGGSTQPTPAPEATPSVTPAAPTLSGTPKIALLLPLSASGGTGTAAQSLKNAADLAMEIGRAHV